jgi:hypothetical protein
MYRLLALCEKLSSFKSSTRKVKPLAAGPKNVQGPELRVRDQTLFEV